MEPITIDHIRSQIETIEISPAAGAPQTVEWTDEYFKSNFVETFPKFLRPDRAKAVAAASVFLNVYMSSELMSQDYKTICFTLWSYMKKDGHYLFDDLFHTASGIQPLPSLITAKILSDLNPQFLILRGSQTAGQDSSTATFAGVAGQTISITTPQAKNWYHQMWSNLHMSPTDLEIPSNLEIVDHSIYYLGFLALKLMRLCAKQQLSVENNIVATAYPQFKQFWADIPNIELTPPPHADFSLHLGDFLKRFSSSCNLMLTYIVYSATFAPENIMESISGVFSSSCLQSLAYLGLGCINWIYQAGKKLRCTPGRLLRYFDFESLSISVQQIEKWIYHITFVNKGKTHFYSRLFRDGAFPEISTRSQPILSMACAAIVHSTDPDHMIWKIAQFQTIVNNPVDFASAMNIASCITQIFTLKMTEVPRSEEAKKISELMKKLVNIPAASGVSYI